MSIHDFTVRQLAGGEQSLSQYRGQVLLIVNVASRCGFTPQYTGLEALYRKYKDRGFAVLGFPCNQFGAQEPGTEAEIETLLQHHLRRDLPDVREDRRQRRECRTRCIRYLKGEKPGVLGTEAIKWNFTKFLVNRNGEVVRRYAPNATPEEIDADIAALL